MEMLAKVDAVQKASKPKSSPKQSPPLEATPNPTATPPKEGDDEEAYVVHQINTISQDGTYRGSAAGGVFVESFLEKLKTRESPVTATVTRLFENLDTAQAYSAPQNALHPSHASPGDYLPTPASIATPVSSMATPASIASPHSPGTKISTSTPSFFTLFSIPNRMSTDKLTTTYFHEWNSMFGILDQYAFLEEYQPVMNALAAAESTGFYDTKELKNKETFFVVILLVLSLGSLASKDKSASAMAESAKLGNDWKHAFTAQLQTKPEMTTVQALLLAELYSLHTGDIADMWHYRMMAVNMTQRLGLHRCHKSLKLPNGNQLSFVDQEMRRRLFWITYSLDCFSAAQLGAPRLINDESIECALPLNIDEVREDEKPADGGDGANTASPVMTQMSCPLSFIHFSKCLANILDTIYSCVKKTHPYKTVVMLEDQLESWRRDLPPDLKFEFSNGAPAALLAPVHQKSPLLLMLYHYAKILIHMPALTGAPTSPATVTPHSRGSASCVAVMQSAKVLLQVQNYLKARNVIPTIPLNPSRSAVFFGTLVLYGAIDYSKCGALLLDIRKVVSASLSHMHSDVQLHRPGALTLETFQGYEEICDLLLSINYSSRKGSTSGTCGDDQRKRKTMSGGKRRDSKGPVSGVPSYGTQQNHPAAVAEDHEVPEDTETLRYNAINDLLYLNTIASQKQQQQKQQQHQQQQHQQQQQQQQQQSPHQIIIKEEHPELLDINRSNSPHSLLQHLDAPLPPLLPPPQSTSHQRASAMASSAPIAIRPSFQHRHSDSAMLNNPFSILSASTSSPHHQQQQSPQRVAKQPPQPQQQHSSYNKKSDLLDYLGHTVSWNESLQHWTKEHH